MASFESITPLTIKNHSAHYLANKSSHMPMTDKNNALINRLFDIGRKYKVNQIRANEKYRLLFDVIGTSVMISLYRVYPTSM